MAVQLCHELYSSDTENDPHKLLSKHHSYLNTESLKGLGNQIGLSPTNHKWALLHKGHIQLAYIQI